MSLNLSTAILPSSRCAFPTAQCKDRDRPRHARSKRAKSDTPAARRKRYTSRHSRAGLAGILSLTAHRNNGQLQIIIYNDGPPLAEGWRLESNEGIGLRNTRDRLEQLYGAKHQIEVRNQGTSGVVARLEIPFRVKPKDGQDKEKDQNGNH